MSDWIAHHGVKGMKWGVWNSDTRARYFKDDRVFVSGKVSYDKPLSKKVRGELDGAMKAGSKILVGDAPGADTRVQDYLAKSGYKNVTVYTSDGKARNNVGGWKEKNIGLNLKDDRKRRAQKDKRMAYAATKAIAIMPEDDRPDSAMSKNLQRLKSYGVPTTLYDFMSDKMSVSMSKNNRLARAFAKKFEGKEMPEYESDFNIYDEVGLTNSDWERIKGPGIPGMKWGTRKNKEGSK